MQSFIYYIDKRYFVQFRLYQYKIYICRCKRVREYLSYFVVLVQILSSFFYHNPL